MIRNFLFLVFMLMQWSLSANDSSRYLIFRDTEFPISQGYIRDGRKVVVKLEHATFRGRIILENDSTFGLKLKNDSIVRLNYKDIVVMKKVRPGQDIITFSYLGIGMGIWAGTIISNATQPQGESVGKGMADFIAIVSGAVFNLAAVCNTHKKKFEPAHFTYKVRTYSRSPSRTQVIMELGGKNAGF